MACTNTCRRPTPHQAHCGACHATFGGVTGFDEHRAGPVDDRRCLDPAQLGYVERGGVWRRPMDDGALARRRAARPSVRAV